MEYSKIFRCMAQCFGHLCLFIVCFFESCCSSDTVQAAVNLSPPPPLSALKVHLPGVKWEEKQGNVEHICQECNLHLKTEGRNSKNISHFMPHSQLTRRRQQSVHHMQTGRSFHGQELGLSPINLNGHFSQSILTTLIIYQKRIKCRYCDRWSFVVVFVCLFFFILAWICLLSEIIWMYFSKSPFCN